MKRDEQPEPCVFVAPLELDGDPPPAQLTVRGVVGMVAALVLFLVLMGYATGCASTHHVYRACVETCAAARCTPAEREQLCAATRRLP